MTDTERIEQAVEAIRIFSVAPYLILTLVYLGIVVGPVSLVPFAVYIVNLCFTTAIGRTISKLRKYTADITDKRIQTMNEILNNMKTLKIICLEKVFSKTVNDIRHLELKSIRKLLALTSFATTSKGNFEVILKVLAVVSLLLWKGWMSQPEIFTIFAATLPFGVMLIFLPTWVKQIADLHVAIKRIEVLLQMEEFVPVKGSSQEIHCRDIAVKLTSVQLYRAPPAHETTGKAKMTKDKECKIGSGGEKAREMSGTEPEDIANDRYSDRSTISQNPAGSKTLEFTIKKCHRESGEVLVNGTIAYVPQASWITSATFRENIVMGNQFDQGRYDQVLKDCCLMKDVSLLSEGDQTEIGERGVNLSGGQKQRVSLARALYSNRDIYLLDDPLSALDASIADVIFRQCIMGLWMKGKTTLIVTHQVQLLSQCDNVLFFSHTDPPIMSSHAELLEANEKYTAMISSAQPEKKPHTAKHPIIEDSKPIQITWSSFMTYVGYAGSRIWLTAGILLIISLSALVIMSAPVLTAIWFEFVPQPENCTVNCQIITYQGANMYLMTILLLIPPVSLCFTILSTAAITLMACKASRNLHAELFTRLMGGTLTFFEETPIGVIQNWFSSDVDMVDNCLPFDLEKTVMLLSRIAICLIAFVVIWPLEGVLILICILLISAIGVVSFKALNLLQKLEKMAKSPICTLASSTIDGLASISVYGKTQKFQNAFFALVDRHCITNICSASVGQFSFFWIGLVSRAPLVSVVVVLTLLPTTYPESGLLLILSILITMIVPYATQNVNKVCSHVASVERIHRFTQAIPQEKTSHNKPVKSLEHWPLFGEITFRNVVLRYKPTMTPTLKHATFHVKAREKIGVVGRSGAGKSSIISALLRLVELDEGSIVIDNVDISRIGLSELRSKIFLLPQDPAIFKGTIRSNLDPFEEKSDLEIWEALAMCHLLHKIRALPSGLSHSVMGGNSTLSMGEKQLVGLTRAVLQRSQIMLLDEATASVDPHTESLIQDTLRTVFARSTMLIVAHRLKTVMHCDKIMVVSEGQVIEFDTPSNLLKYNSHFKRLWDSSDNKDDD
ncbi:ATP-binding cassette sub-family C member 5-like [Liolophura sinensis]|uniref:ATP-binding cassette sub-family C member 5-like n=1 Tax=Liolophura sinensis TaxID=3198878 RepID=UPI003159469C